MIRRDIVIRFNSLTFSWTALLGFQSTGKPLFSQVALSGFQLVGCTYIFYFIPNFCLNRPFGFSIHRDAYFCPSRPFGFSTCRVIYAQYLLTMSAFAGCSRSSPSMVVKIIAPPEKMFLITNGPLQVGVHLPLGSLCDNMIRLSGCRRYHYVVQP